MVIRVIDFKLQLVVYENIVVNCSKTNQHTFLIVKRSDLSTVQQCILVYFAEIMYVNQLNCTNNLYTLYNHLAAMYHCK